MTTRHRIGLDPNDAKRDLGPDFKERSQSVYEELRASSETVYDFGTNVLASMLDGSEPVGAAVEGVEAAFAAMVMTAYAALETLAADLWIESVNRDSKLAGNWFEKSPDKQLPGNLLAGYDFNLSASMGTVLHSTRKVTFESWSDIRGHMSLRSKIS